MTPRQAFLSGVGVQNHWRLRVMLWKTGTVELVLLYVKNKGVNSQPHLDRIDPTRSFRASRLNASEVAHNNDCATTL